MTCHNCKIEAKKFGKDRKGNQRYRCAQCRKTFQELKENLLGNMRISLDKAEMCLRLLLEGNSIRSTQRITGLHQETILNLLVLAGEKCERLMNDRIKDVPVKDVEIDETWGFVQCKMRHKLHKQITDPHVGDAYTFVAIERNSKLVLTWHLGERDMLDTEIFTEKLDRATSGRFQLTADGFVCYPSAVAYSLGVRVDFAQLIKVYASNREGEQKYSPPEVVDTVTKVIIGSPDPRRICTSMRKPQHENLNSQTYAVNERFQ